jgi:hypothetical protein
VKQYLLGVIFLILPFIASAEITFAQLAKISMTPEKLEGRFSQEKYLSALDAALVSTGVFDYQRGKSIRWAILEPIQNETLMTPGGITSSQNNNQLLQLDVSTDPTAAVLGEIFFAVLTSEWEKLAEFFELSGSIEGDRWHAVLVPLERTAMQVFSRIELKGKSLLQEIILHEASGDRTTIRLDSQR